MFTPVRYFQFQSLRKWWYQQLWYIMNLLVPMGYFVTRKNERCCSICSEAIDLLSTSLDNFRRWQRRLLHVS
jgi:hypothetical protein